MLKKNSPSKRPADLVPANAITPVSALERLELRWVARVVGGLFLLLLLVRHYQAMDFVQRPSIPLYPGQYEHVVFHSGKAVSAAMQVVYMAPDATALSSAIAAVQRMAAAGNAEAAFRLGRYYHLESDRPDYALALKYYRIASHEGNAWATNNLGLLYRYGLGVPLNDVKAHDYFLRAARRHNPWAYVNLAEMSFLGEDVPANRADGIAWLEKGTADHCSLCAIEEAEIYHSGSFGVPSNPGKAAAVLRRASALGEPEPGLILAELYLVGDGVPQSPAKAFGLLQTLSARGFARATNLLGELSAGRQILDYRFKVYLGGVRHIAADFHGAFPQNPGRAIRYWRLADKQGDCQSLINLSSVFDRGVGVSVDRKIAAGYVERAVACDPTNTFFLWKLAARYRDAEGMQRNCAAAERYFAKSFDGGYGYAAAGVDLGYIYDKGCGPIARDDHRAFEIYLLCAKLGVPLCQNNVGAMIKHGRGVPAADPARGYAWMKLAALRGSKLARENLIERPFAPAVRVVGMVELADVELRLASTPSDPRAIMRDPWY